MWVEDNFVVILRKLTKIEDIYIYRWHAISLPDIHPREILSRVHLEIQHFVITKTENNQNVQQHGYDYKKICCVGKNECPLVTHTWTWMNHKNNVELKKQSVHYTYIVYIKVTNKQSYLCYFVILFRKVHICGTLVNYREKQKND